MSQPKKTADTLPDSLPDRLNKAQTLLKTADSSTPPDLISAFYERALPEDLALHTAPALAHAAAQAWAAGHDRPKNTPVITLTPASTEKHLWHAPRTLLQIVNDDMPFLVDSIMGELNEQGLRVHVLLYPVLHLRRDAKGRRTGLAPPGEGTSESFFHIELDPLSKEAAERLKKTIATVLSHVRVSVDDWKPMIGQLQNAITDLRTAPPPGDLDINEHVAFLEWLAGNHFTFLGFRSYKIDADLTPSIIPCDGDAGLGLLRDPNVHVLRRGGELVSMTPEMREFLSHPNPLIVTKANVRSRVHRRAYMDYIGVKHYDGKQLVGERRFIGLFTSAAYNRNTRVIPMLRRKVADVIERSGFTPDGHDGKALLNVMETFPRDELFQVSGEELAVTATGILNLAERPRTRLFARPDRFDRFVSVLVFVPRERYTTDLRRRIGDILCRAYNGRLSAWYPRFGEEPLAQVHFIVGRNPGPRPDVDVARLEADVVRAARNWIDDLAEQLHEQQSASDADTLLEKYRDSFSAAYRDSFSAGEAIADIERMESLSDTTPLALRFHRRAEQASDDAAPPDDTSDDTDDTAVRLKLYRCGDPIALSDLVPPLENMGLRVIKEYSHTVTPRDGEAVQVHDLDLTTRSGAPIDLENRRALLEEAFLAVWNGRAEDDDINSLVLSCAMPWRVVALLRTYAKYLRQTRTPFSMAYLRRAITDNPAIARLLIKVFCARFAPGKESSDARAGTEEAAVAELEQALDQVASLDSDRILRHMLNLIRSTLRTNFFQSDASQSNSGKTPKPAIALKLDSARIDGLPEPRPHVEIFVYAPDVEGIHLRGGPIARGGLRWSDRPEDFRTEVLGLAKAQNVKNAVIVPVGAKGGFVPRHLPLHGGREAVQAEGRRCYTLFIQSLLDITDNLAGDTVVPPEQVVRHDGDDPYLVVAADKGTATFSDLANQISDDYGFWLGDAFASGGSNGYDHKKMGITARGAWEAVRRHFCEMDRDIQSEPFSVIGVGDMSGDVFGNGMLLSKHTRLLAAFDHRCIFIDPDPDPATSWTERKRLFDMPRSSWSDYNPDLISKGGGVFERSLKGVPLSPEIQKLIYSDADTLTPVELIRALLCADADLIWFGGIGTYVRASDETDADVGDRASDSMRVTASDLRAKVIGEGANLGATQRGRIEFALAGGCVNTDAVDNSAGVNSSDLEVNIKIALSAAMTDKTLPPDQRGGLLAAMTDDVAALVLRNNRLQTLALTMDEQAAASGIDPCARFMRRLEQEGRLDRALEDLPDDETLSQRAAAQRGLTRPELAVLMAYAKIALFDALRAGSLPDDPWLTSDLQRYFPAAIAKHPQAIAGHRLRREIISTMLANSLVNRCGITFISETSDRTQAPPDAILRAFVIARTVHHAVELGDEIDALDNQIPAAIQLSMRQDAADLLRRQTVWFLHNLPRQTPIQEAITHHTQVAAAVMTGLNDILPARIKSLLEERIRPLAKAGVSSDLAERIAALTVLAATGDIALIAQKTGRPVVDAARAFFAMGDQLGFIWLAQAAAAIPAGGHFDRLALQRLDDSLAVARRALTIHALAGDHPDPVPQWCLTHADQLAPVRTTLAELEAGAPLDLARLSVAAGQMSDLAHSL